MSWRTVLPRLSMTRMNAHSHSEQNNAPCVRAIHKASKDRSYKNLKQPRQSSETRTAQRAKSGVRDSPRWTAQVRGSNPH